MTFLKGAPDDSESWVPTPTPHDDSSIAAGFHVPVCVKECAYGKGVFATCCIPRGALIWKGTPNVNVLEYEPTETAARARIQDMSRAEAID